MYARSTHFRFTDIRHRFIRSTEQNPSNPVLHVASEIESAFAQCEDCYVVEKVSQVNGLLRQNHSLYTVKCAGCGQEEVVPHRTFDPPPDR